MTAENNTDAKVRAYLFLRARIKQVQDATKRKVAELSADMVVLENSLRRDLDAHAKQSKAETMRCGAGTIFYKTHDKYVLEDRSELEGAVNDPDCSLSNSIFTNALAKSEVEAYIEESIAYWKGEAEREGKEFDLKAIPDIDLLPPGVKREVYRELSVRKSN